MKSFLEGRETITGEGIKFVVGEPITLPAGPAGNTPGLRRETAAAGGGSAGASAAPREKVDAHEPTVKPVVENGRVVGVVVTCSCGKKTEIGLEY